MKPNAMLFPPVSPETVKKQAQDAAAIYTDINDACPYPFGTDQAHAFKAEFLYCRSVIDAKATEQVEASRP